jgi:hypothetical protein
MKGLVSLDLSGDLTRSSVGLTAFAYRQKDVGVAYYTLKEIIAPYFIATMTLSLK